MLIIKDFPPFLYMRIRYYFKAETGGEAANFPI